MINVGFVTGAVHSIMMIIILANYLSLSSVSNSIIINQQKRTFGIHQRPSLNRDVNYIMDVHSVNLQEPNKIYPIAYH